MEILRTIIHYGLHFIAPGLLAYIFFRDIWKKGWLIMIATMLVDLDHLLATPVFDPERCSIGYHPLHSLPTIIFYILLLFSRNRYIQIIGLGLVFHMITDFLDCLWIMDACSILGQV